jgi:hypothetical protein
MCSITSLLNDFKTSCGGNAAPKVRSVFECDAADIRWGCTTYDRFVRSFLLRGNDVSPQEPWILDGEKHERGISRSDNPAELISRAKKILGLSPGLNEEVQEDLQQRALDKELSCI